MMGMMHFLYFSPIRCMAYRQKLRLLSKPIWRVSDAPISEGTFWSAHFKQFERSPSDTADN
jgi:hypothetical protein